MSVFQIICLFVMVWLWPINMIRAVKGQGVGALALLVAAIATTAFIVSKGWI